MKTSVSRWASLIEEVLPRVTFAPCHLFMLLSFEHVKLYV